MSGFACFECGLELELENLLICECSSALLCSEECAAKQPCELHVEAKNPAAGGNDPKPKRKRKDADLVAAESTAKQLLKELKETADWKNSNTLERYRLLQSHAQLPASELISVLKTLHKPQYYPHVLHNQAMVAQAPLDLHGPTNDPTVIAMLSSAQRVIADTWGPWSKTKGGEAKWDTGVGKTPLLHAIAKNYRHEQVLQPNLNTQDPEIEKLEGCTVLVVTQPHLRFDVMKGMWAQNNRDPAWITAQIRAAGLCADDVPTPFTSANVITGRQLTNAMSGIGPLARALWSGLPLGKDGKVCFRICLHFLITRLSLALR